MKTSSANCTLLFSCAEEKAHNENPKKMHTANLKSTPFLTTPPLAPHTPASHVRTSPRDSSTVRDGKINHRPLGHDPERVAQRARRVIALFVNLKVDGLGDAGRLIQLTCVRPQIGIINEAANVALEGAVIRRVKAC